MCLLQNLKEEKANRAQVTLLLPLSLALPQPQQAGKVEVGFFFLLHTFSDVLHFYLLGSLRLLAVVSKVNPFQSGGVCWRPDRDGPRCWWQGVHSGPGHPGHRRVLLRQ